MTRSTRSRAVLLALILSACALAFGAAQATAARGVTTTRSQAAVCDTGKVHFAKTKFLFHAGLAFGVFHRYIYKPFKAGAFKSGAHGRLKAAVKAAVAALFVWHELKLACKDANSSSVLKPLLTPLNLIVETFNKLAAKLKSGNFGLGDFTNSASAVSGLEQKSSGLGVPIKEFVSGFSG